MSMIINRFVIISLLIASTSICYANDFKMFNSNTRPLYTYSIVARDPETSQIGVAVQSHWFSVGSIVPWAEAGVGAVATQALTDVTYGPHGLKLMRTGVTAKEALDTLLATDEGRDFRQVAMINAKGDVAVHTGKKCVTYAGHFAGTNYSVQANFMLNDKVLKEMSRAYEDTNSDLADKMLAALCAAQKVGGDIRGKQSAAILIVKGKSTGSPWRDKVMELRVEDHLEPVKELKRLVKLQRAYNHLAVGEIAMQHNNYNDALKEYVAAQELVPDNLEIPFWAAVSFVKTGKTDDSLPLFKRIFKEDYNWAILIQRMSKTGLLPDDQKLIDKILSMAPKKNGDQSN